MERKEKKDQINVTAKKEKRGTKTGWPTRIFASCCILPEEGEGRKKGEAEPQ